MRIASLVVSFVLHALVPRRWVAAQPSHETTAFYRITSPSSSSSLKEQASSSWRGGGGGGIIREAELPTSIYPEWFTPMDQDTLQPFLELARQRHDQAIQKARESYYHFDPSVENHNKDAIIVETLTTLDEMAIKSTQQLPDFHEALKPAIFVTKDPLFTKEECRAVIEMAEEHFRDSGSGSSSSSSNEWSRLSSGQYLVAGFWIRNVPSVHAWFNRMVQNRLFPLLARQFPNFVASPHDLVVDNAYMFKYTPETGRRTDVHTDSGCLSFTIALNQRQDEYQGGGTWFEGLVQTTTSSSSSSSPEDNDANSVLEMNVGQVTIRPGGVRHCGHAVTEGVRYIIGGFCMHVNKVEPVRQLLGLASELLQEEQHWKQAEKVLQAALTINPNFDGVYTHLATVYQKLGQKANAKQGLEHCHAHVNPKSGDVAYSLGLLCLEQGEYEKVQSCMRVCLEADANDVDAMALMAQALAHRRQQREQQQQQQQRKSGDTTLEEEEEEEERWYRRIVQSPDATPQQLASAFCNLGVLHEGRDDEVQLYKKSLDYDATNFATWYSLACAHASQKQYLPAAQAFRQAVALAGGDGTANQSKALHALYRLAVTQLREQAPSKGISSQQDMLQELKQIMGEDNYNRLAAEKR